MTKNPKNGLRAQILRAARKLLVKEGIQNVSMRKIAAEIGCKAPSIYYHFRNKDELIHTLIDEGHRRMLQFMSSAQDALGEEIDALEKVETNIRAFVSFGLENPEFYEIMYLLYSEEISRYPTDGSASRRQVLEHSASIYKAAMDAGVIETCDSYVLATTTATMLNGFVASVLMRRIDNRFDQDLLQEELIRRVLMSMGATVNAKAEEVLVIS